MVVVLIKSHCCPYHDILSHPWTQRVVVFGMTYYILCVSNEGRNYDLLMYDLRNYHFKFMGVPLWSLYHG